MTARGTGLVIHHDVRNENFLLSDVLPKPKLAARGAGPVEFTPKTKRHRQYGYVDQGNTPRCTGYGCVTLCLAAHPYNSLRQLLALGVTGDTWYHRNVDFDRRYGRWYSGGATVTAALEVGRTELKLFSEYRWAYTIRTMQEGIPIAPLIAGTYWYPSMFRRNAENIVDMPSANERTDEGHLYCIRGYDARRDLWICPNTWGDGDYLIPGDLMHRLLREEGEVAQITEVDLPALKRAA